MECPRHVGWNRRNSGGVGGLHNGHMHAEAVIEQCEHAVDQQGIADNGVYACAMKNGLSVGNVH